MKRRGFFAALFAAPMAAKAVAVQKVEPVGGAYMAQVIHGDSPTEEQRRQIAREIAAYIDRYREQHSL